MAPTKLHEVSDKKFFLYRFGLILAQAEMPVHEFSEKC